MTSGNDTRARGLMRSIRPSCRLTRMLSRTNPSTNATLHRAGMRGVSRAALLPGEKD